jgi:hypothetical protein
MPFIALQSAGQLLGSSTLVLLNNIERTSQQFQIFIFFIRNRRDNVLSMFTDPCNPIIKSKNKKPRRSKIFQFTFFFLVSFLFNYFLNQLQRIQGAGHGAWFQSKGWILLRTCIATKAIVSPVFTAAPMALKVRDTWPEMGVKPGPWSMDKNVSVTFKHPE